jgi:hypothetical protein
VTALAWLIAIPVAIYALLFWLGILIAAGLAACAVIRPRLEARRGLRDLERDLAERSEH